MNPDRISQCLVKLYGEKEASSIYLRIEKLAEKYGPKLPKSGKFYPDQKRIVLITYADMVSKDGRASLQILKLFLDQTVKGLIDTLHILPFYPYSSDDGFSVIDYRKVKQEYGSWDDILSLRESFELAFDAVFNHISSESQWFQKCLVGDPKYSNYFITESPKTDLSLVVRPRSLPLLSPYKVKNEGTKYFWTTFSADQLDVNVSNPDTLVELIEILLFYVSHGASLIRLDAIAFLWKKIDTDCLHLEETHIVVKLFREILNQVAPHVGLLTETNVPHNENITYFGDGDEAHMIYQFSLPPLTAHAILTENVSYLTEWAARLEPLPENCTYFNFLASHDGIGIRPLTGIIDESEISSMVDIVKERGGYVSYKQNSDGSESPYEMNINYLSLFDSGNEEDAIDKFLLAHSLLMTMPGVPGIYFHSLFGSKNYSEGVLETGRKRSINREKLDYDLLIEELNSEESCRNKVFSQLTEMLKCRRQHQQFSPQADFQVLPQSDFTTFIIRRGKENDSDHITAIHNFSSHPKKLETYTGAILFKNIISDSFDSSDNTIIPPFGFMWLTKA